MIFQYKNSSSAGRLFEMNLMLRCFVDVLVIYILFIPCSIFIYFSHWNENGCRMTVASICWRQNVLVTKEI